MIDTTNKFLVGRQGDQIVIMKKLPSRLTIEEALNLAAYLVCMGQGNPRLNLGEPMPDSFQEILEAIQSA